MTPTQIRNGTVLGLTICGIYAWVWATWEDPMARRMVMGLGCFLLAWVYAQLTKPRERE